MYRHLAKVTSRIYFGKYIDDDVLQELNEIGIDIIIDLTHWSDRLAAYECDIVTIKFPIRDMDIAEDDAVMHLLTHLKILVEDGQRIYIHCKGGHGRSAVIAACLYGQCHSKDGSKALGKVWRAHQRRLEMRPRWRRLGAPQTDSQITQVLRILG